MKLFVFLAVVCAIVFVTAAKDNDKKKNKGNRKHHNNNSKPKCNLTPNNVKPTANCIDKYLLCPRIRHRCCEKGKNGDLARKLCKATCGLCKPKIGKENLQLCGKAVKMQKSCLPIARYNTEVKEVLKYRVQKKCNNADAEKYVVCMVAGRDLSSCCIKEGALACLKLCRGIFDYDTAVKCIGTQYREKVRRCINGKSKYST